MKIYEKLLEIQVNLKATKSQFNKFGNYSYRSLDDIYEAVKPLLKHTKTTLTLDDDLEVFNGVIFRKSTATLTDIESGEKIQTHTYTQESMERKGMSAEQCSGSVASYGNKYCLNKLFCIDDAKDADTRDNKEEAPIKPVSKPTAPKMTVDEKRKLLMATLSLLKRDGVESKKWIEQADELALDEQINRFKKEGVLS